MRESYATSAFLVNTRRHFDHGERTVRIVRRIIALWGFAKMAEDMVTHESTVSVRAVQQWTLERQDPVLGREAFAGHPHAHVLRHSGNLTENGAPGGR